jgi:hypothetical protein
MFNLVAPIVAAEVRQAQHTMESYLHVRYMTKAGECYATCWNNRLWPALVDAVGQLAADGKPKPLTFTVDISGGVDHVGRPFLKILGVEDPRQQQLF